MAMDIMKANCEYQLVECYDFLYVLKRITFAFSLLYLIIASQFASAETVITPGIIVGETVVHNEFDSFSETGFVTSIQPGVIINSNNAKSTFFMAYGLELLRSHDLETNDDREVHNLDLSGEFRHIPNQWTSYVRANNQLNNSNVDGVQSANPEFLDVNSEQLFTLDVGSAYSDRLSRNVQYSAGVNLNYVDEEGSDSSTGQEVSLSIDNFISDNVLTWRGQIKRNEYQDDNDNDNDNDRIDELEVLFNYRFDQALNYFLELSRTETDDSELNENRAIVGFRWSPTRQSFVSVGVGRLGDDETYDFEASLTRARSLFTARYSESITTQRDQLFELQDDQFGQSTNQSISTIAILRKRGDIGWTLTGVRSTLEVSAFHEEESNPNVTDDQITTGGDIIYSRQLSPHSSLSLSASYQETEFTEDSTLDEYRVGYEKSTSKTTDLELFVSYASFDSSNDDIDYEQTLAGATYRVTF
jgi:hypothetical protein